MINPMNRSTPIRMMGMASGMDTDFIIQNAMRAHQFRIDQRVRQRTLIEWRQQTHNSIGDQLREFQRTLLSMQSPRSMFASNNFNTHVANITGLENHGISITTRASSTMGSFEIRSVNSLARGASIRSQERVSGNNQGFTLTSRLGSLNFRDDNHLRFQNDRLTLNFAEAGEDANNVSFERVWTGGGQQGTAYGSFEYHVLDAAGNRTGQTLTAASFQDNAYLARGVANVNVGGEIFRVTRTADGNLQRVNMGTQTNVTFNSSGNRDFTIGDQVVRLTREGEGTVESPHTFSFSIRNEDGKFENFTAITPGSDGFFNITVPQGDDPARTLRLAINERMDGDDGDVHTGRFDVERVTDTVVSTASIHWGRLEEPVVINGYTVEGIHRNMTINDMMRTINNDSRLNVTISYDQISDRFTIESNDIGSDSSITVSGLDILGLGGNVYDDDDAIIQTGVNTAGSTSSITIWDGNENIILEGGTTNSVNFGGVTINFTREFEGATAADSAVVNITRNVDQAFENITNFINSYNAIISRIEGLLRERKTPAERSYMPLTDEEKQHMTERQIEQWEEIARRGIMRNDHALENLARELRNSFFSEIEGLGMRPSDLGLSTGSFFDGTGGQIFINEERLRAALEEDPDRVMAVFTQQGDTRAQQGLVTRINATINGFIGISGAGGTQRNTLSALERSIRNVNEQIERMTVRMFAEEDRLFRQFAAMERAMSQLQSQGDWFNAMLGSMN